MPDNKEMANLLIALQALNLLLITVSEAGKAATAVTGIIIKARNEKRDLTQDEINEISAETDKLEGKVLQKLDSIVNPTT